MDSMGKRGGAAPPRPATAAAIREAAREGTRPAPRERPKQPTRRVYTAAYKVEVLRKLEELEVAGERGAQGAYLRREGLKWAHAHRWRQERDAGGLAALTPKKRGPKSTRDPAAAEVERLRRQNERLQEQLRKAEIIIEVQKKLSALLGAELPVSPTDEEKP